MPYAILVTISYADVIHTAFLGWLVYKLTKPSNIQRAEPFMYEASAPEADIALIDSFNHNVEMKTF
jgi:hypothetical protein